MFSHLNPIPSLTKYTGHYKVGTTEFEIPISEIPSTSVVPDPQVSTIKFRIFYPTTPDATSKQSVYWVPTPQNKWVEAYASFMGAGSRFSNIIANLPSLLNYVKIPAVKDAPLLRPTSTSWPVCIFSHGLGGNYNTYSSIVGSLASCGVVCITPEHRDGSAPISFIKNAEGKTISTIPYQKHSHSPSTDVYNARNSQLRVRMWELELTYTVISAMNEGKVFTNLAEDSQSRPQLQRQLNLEPGKVFWAGHSFGAATTAQFVKSIFYHQHLPTTPETMNSQVDWTPLYRTTSGSDLVKQITAESPVALLDLWTMPLRSETTKWLWERPMPSYARDGETNLHGTPNTIGIMSAEFHRWTDLLNRTRALLSRTPAEAAHTLQKEQKIAEAKDTVKSEESEVEKASKLPSSPFPELSKQTSRSLPGSSEVSRNPSPARPSQSLDLSRDPATSSTSVEPSSEHSQDHDKDLEKLQVEMSSEPQLYMISQSAHLSQSDFGPLFPSLVKYVMKAIEPEKTVELNVRAMASLLKGCGLPVKNLSNDDDFILGGDGQAKEPRWVRVPLVNS